MSKTGSVASAMLQLNLNDGGTRNENNLMGEVEGFVSVESEELTPPKFVIKNWKRTPC